MSKRENTALVPKYRFPEFTFSKEWDVKKLGSVTFSVSRKNNKGKKYPIYSINNKDGFLPQEEQFEGVDSNSRGYDISLYKIVGEKTFAYNPARINVGSIGYSGTLQDIMISSLYVCFKTSEDIDDCFFQYFLSTHSFKRQVVNNTEGGIRNYLFYENFSNIIFSFPTLDEQQKIANCLSSLDDLIAAEDSKLSALRTHKKGLMKKLFPGEGKTVPEWRFPEFADCGKWKEISFKQVFGKLQYGLNAAAKQYDGKNKYIRITDIDETSRRYLCENPVSSDCELDDSYLVRDRDILFTRTGASTGKTYIYNQEDGVLYFAGFLIRGNVNEQYEPQFIFAQTLSLSYEKWVAVTSIRSGQPGINASEYESFKFFCPTFPEQQKIAYCLSSIDASITAQTEKIQALNKHKRALMQGLFPSIKEVVQ
jgi:type I restriction enzyme S subunit